MHEGRSPLPAEWRPLYVVAFLLAFGLLLYAALPVLSPLVAFLVLLVLGAPYARERPVTLVLIAGLLVVTLWALEVTGSLLAPFVLALVLAYVLDPLVDRLVALRVPRGLAIVLLALPVFALLALAIVLGVPALAAQVAELIQEAPGALRRLQAWTEANRDNLFGVDLPFIDEQRLLEPLATLDADRIMAFVQQRQEQIAGNLWEAVVGVGRGIGFVLSLLGYIVLTPVLTFYLLRDWDGLVQRTSDLVPPEKRPRWGSFAREYDDLLSRYLRGQLLAAATVGVLTGVGLWILGFPYPAVVGVVAGVFNLVPYLGLIVSLIPAVIIALLSGSILASLGKVALVFVVVQALDGTVIGPRIVGGSVGLHPVVVILALALGSFFFGFVGLLIAVPLALLAKMLIVRGLGRYRASRLYNGRSTA